MLVGVLPFLGGHQSRMVSSVVKHVSIVSCISSNASSSSSFSFDPADAAERVKEYIGVRLQMIVCYIFCYLHLICCHVFSECTVQCQEISTPPAPPAPSLPSIQRSLHVHGSSVDDGSPVQDLPN